MKRAIPITIMMLTLVGCATGGMKTSQQDASSLVGTWRVDLRPTPGSPGYYKEFVVSSVHRNNFSGVFYGSSITNGRINVDWGAVRIGFVTADLSGQYNHSAVMTNGKLEGLTYSEGRGFLSYWSAEKR
ncbi:MAG: hypothetical protein V4723_18030 [Pseudomonadota bacterium]